MQKSNAKAMRRKVTRKSSAKTLETVLYLGVLCSAYGQVQQPVTQTATKSSCVNIVALSGAKVDCTHLTEEQQKAIADIPAILKMALEDQSYFKEIREKLDELSKQGIGSATVAVTQTGYGNSANPGVNGAPITQGSCGVVQIGGSGNTAAPNCGPIARKISTSQKAEFAACLSGHKGSVDILNVAGTGEGFDLGMDWLDVFKAAGWTVDDGVVHTGIQGGGRPTTGLQFNVNGTYSADGRQVTYDHDTPSGQLVDCINGKDLGQMGKGMLQADPKYSSTHVVLIVGPSF
jgi:hypothetical protein